MTTQDQTRSVWPGITVARHLALAEAMYTRGEHMLGAKVAEDAIGASRATIEEVKQDVLDMVLQLLKTRADTVRSILTAIECGTFSMAKENATAESQIWDRLIGKHDLARSWFNCIRQGETSGPFTVYMVDWLAEGLADEGRDEDAPELPGNR